MFLIPRMPKKKSRGQAPALVALTDLGHKLQLVFTLSHIDRDVEGIFYRQHNAWIQQSQLQTYNFCVPSINY